MDSAFTYAEGTAMLTEDQYPYTGWKGVKNCQHGDETGTVSVSDFYDVTTNSPSQLKAALDLGPVSVAIQADQAVF